MSKKIKEIYCLAHSHYDIGYTHPQNMLNELQCDYIDNAIDLCLKTENYPEESQFRWTCEAVSPVLDWWKTASDEKKNVFRRLVKENRISICAFPFHFTPNANARQIAGWLSDLDKVRALTGAEIIASISHDVNGVPWSVPSMLLDAGVKMMISGPNLDHGGIPFRRPYLYNWQTKDGRSIPFMLGEQYQFFTGVLRTAERNIETMHENALDYVKWVEENSPWHDDFVYLTATNTVLCDNNSPDYSLPDLIRDYNAKGYEPKLRFCTPEMLYKRVEMYGKENLASESGDWTDYWNFGTASTSKETKLNRRAKTLLAQSDFIRAIAPEKMPKKLDALSKEAYMNSLLFDEHTWGCWASVSNPDWENCYAQLRNKEVFALKAAESSAYITGKAQECYLDNPIQSEIERDMVFINPTDMPVDYRVSLPYSGYNPVSRALSAARIREKLPYDDPNDSKEDIGYITLKPYEKRRVSISSVRDKVSKENKIVKTETGFITPYYEVILDDKAKEIRQIISLSDSRKLLDESGEWKFFDVVEEMVDTSVSEPVRESQFRGRWECFRYSETGWFNDWKAVRKGCDDVSEAEITDTTYGDTIISYHSKTEHMADIVRTIRFSSYKPGIELDISFHKSEERAPLGIYTVFPVKLNKGWKGVFDTADLAVEFDNEQLGHACRDYVTVDRACAMYDDNGCIVLSCPDAPMVMMGGFWYGREMKSIPRDENPVLLGWPMNNYWQTNFLVSEDGWQHFHYELTAIEKFTPEQFRRIGSEALMPVMSSRSVLSGEEGSCILWEKTSEHSSVLYTVHLSSEDGFMIAVENEADECDTFTLKLNTTTIGSASKTDLIGNVIEMLSIKDNSISVNLKPHEISYIRIR